MSKPWFKFYAADYLTDRDINELTFEQRGILLSIWCLIARQNECSLDTKLIAKQIGIEHKKLLKHWSILEQFLVKTDTGYYSKRLLDETQSEEEKSIFFSKIGKIGGDAKAKKNSSVTPEKNPSMTLDENSGCQSQSQSQKVQLPPIPPKGGELDSAEVISTWNSVCGAKDLPKVIKLEGKRKTALMARLAEKGWLDDFKIACDYIANHPDAGWARGETDRGWKADIDYLLKPGNVSKLVEKARTKPAARASPSRASPRTSHTTEADAALAEQLAEMTWDELPAMEGTYG